jgi:hypothetical protein
MQQQTAESLNDSTPPLTGSEASRLGAAFHAIARQAPSVRDGGRWAVLQRGEHFKLPA